MPFTRPTLAELASRILGDFQTRITGATTFLRRSVVYILSRVLAGAFHLTYGFLDFQSKQLFALTADTDYLDQHGSELGIPRTASTKATGSGTATGTAATALPINSELQSSTGVVYLTDAAYTIGAGGSVLISFTAKEAGADGNDLAGITLTFVSPIPGVNTSVTVDSNAIDGGANQETDEPYRTRILARKRRPPHGGANFDYVEWAKEVSGVTRAWAVSNYQGNGTVALIFARDNDATLFPSAAEIATVRSYVISHADPITGETVGIPVGAENGFFTPTPAPKTIDFNIAIYPNTAAVQAAVRSQLEDLMIDKGGPEQTIYLSQMTEAISAATDEERHRIILPSTDQTATQVQIHVLGTITFSELT
jgi:uncharacterized phage protein gp47/JayE